MKNHSHFKQLHDRTRQSGVRRRAWNNESLKATKSGRQRSSHNAFFNSKSTKSHSDPGRKIKQYPKNDKNVKKYKGGSTQEWHSSTATTPEGDEGDREGGGREEKGGGMGFLSLRQVYEKAKSLKDKEIMERKELIKKKMEEKELAVKKRKAMKAKMMKKTWRGQTLMKHRIEHLLQNIMAQE